MAAIWGAVIAAGLGYYNSKQQKKAAEKGSSYNTEPWGPSQNYLRDILARGESLSNLPMPDFYGPPPNLRGAGVGQDTKDIAAFLKEMGLSESPFLSQAEGFTDDLFGGLGYNPFLERLSGEEGQISNPGLDEVIRRGLDGNLLDTGYLDQFIQGGLGDLSGFSGAGGFGGGGDFSNPNVDPNPWLRSLLDGEFLDEGNPYVSQMVDDIRREGLETYQQSIVPQIDSTFARSGRYGSGSYREAQVRANEEANESINTAVSQTLGNNYNSERDRMVQGLGMLNNQEIAAMNANASAASASYGARASMMNSARGQLLDAILGDQSGQIAGLGTLMSGLSQYSGDRQFEVDALMKMANQLSTDRLSGLGMIPGLEEARYIGPLAALQGQEPINEARRFNAGVHNQNAMNQYSHSRDRWNYQTNYPWEQLERFANLAIPIGGMGGSGTSFTPYQGQNEWLSALQWGLGGYNAAQGYGG